MDFVFLTIYSTSRYRQSTSNDNLETIGVFIFFALLFIIPIFAAIYEKNRKIQAEHRRQLHMEHLEAEKTRREIEYARRHARQMAIIEEEDRLLKSLDGAFRRFEDARRNAVSADTLRKKLETYQLFLQNFEKENPNHVDLISYGHRKAIEYGKNKLAKMEKYEASLKKDVPKPKKKKPTNTNREPIPKSLRYDVLNRDNFRCCICGRSAEDGVKLHVDHIFPVSKGGKTTMENLRTLCADCNLGKSNKIEKNRVQ